MNDQLSRRENVLAVVFTFSTLVVAVYPLGNVPKRHQFWICAVLSVVSLAASRHRVAFIGALFWFAAIRFAFASVWRPRWEAVVGLIVCAIIALWIVRTFPNDV